MAKSSSEPMQVYIKLLSNCREDFICKIPFLDLGYSGLTFYVCRGLFNMAILFTNPPSRISHGCARFCYVTATIISRCQFCSQHFPSWVSLNGSPHSEDQATTSKSEQNSHPPRLGFDVYSVHKKFCGIRNLGTVP